jgi:hypothetical protein
MTINIDDKTLRQIMTACVKEEIDFLTRVALRREPARKILWTEMRTLLQEACTDAGLSAEGANKIVLDVKNQTPPSGGGGGSDPNDGDSGKSGGGGWEWIEKPKNQDPVMQVEKVSKR